MSTSGLASSQRSPGPGAGPSLSQMNTFTDSHLTSLMRLLIFYSTIHTQVRLLDMGFTRWWSPPCLLHVLHVLSSTCVHEKMEKRSRSVCSYEMQLPQRLTQIYIFFSGGPAVQPQELCIISIWNNSGLETAVRERRAGGKCLEQEYKGVYLLWAGLRRCH